MLKIFEMMVLDLECFLYKNDNIMTQNSIQFIYYITIILFAENERVFHEKNIKIKMIIEYCEKIKSSIEILRFSKHFIIGKV